MRTAGARLVVRGVRGRQRAPWATAPWRRVAPRPVVVVVASIRRRMRRAARAQIPSTSSSVGAGSGTNRAPLLPSATNTPSGTSVEVDAEVEHGSEPLDRGRTQRRASREDRTARTAGPQSSARRTPRGTRRWLAPRTSVSALLMGRRAACRSGNFDGLADADHRTRVIARSDPSPYHPKFHGPGVSSKKTRSRWSPPPTTRS